MKRILFIAPHPDDEILGCGGTIKKYIENGNQVNVLIVTKGSLNLYTSEGIETVRNEARAAHQVLGVNETVFLDFPAPELDTIPIADISSAIAEIIKKFSAQVVFLPHRGDIHNDHRIVFNAALVACRPVPVGMYSVKKVYTYETLSETEWAPPYGDDAFIPNHFINIVDQFETKLKAMECHKKALRPFPNPRSLPAIEALAKFRGATVGIEKAEAFMLIRSIED